MANQANYSKIGFAVVAGAAAIVLTLVYLGGALGKGEVVYAETYSDAPVSGLSVGSAVNLRGVKVGEVKEISFIGSEYDDAKGDDIPKIYILIAFTTSKMRTTEDEDPEEHLREIVKKGIHATVTSSGVTGLSKIELNFPRTPIETRPISWRPRHVCIPPAPSILQSAADSVTQILDQLNHMDFVAAWSNVVQVTGSANVLLQDAATLVDAQKGNAGEIMDNLREASIALRAFADEIRANPAALLRSSTPDRLDETR